MLSACTLDVGDPYPDADEPSNPASESFAPGLGVDISKMERTTSGAYFRDARVGTGAAVSTGNHVLVLSYIGFLKDGRLWTQAFQQTNLMATLVTGLQEGVVGMREGGERIVVIPSELGFGNKRTGPVPGNSTLIFDVRLDAIAAGSPPPN
jgi:FKBP-type peptidyl-prolyl cis-trans isomerase